MKQELSKKPSFARFMAVLISGALMTTIFLFLGTPLLRVLRNVFGAKKYWISGILITALLVVLNPGTVLMGFFLLSFWLSIGLYQELEEKGFANFWTACLSILVGSALIILGPYFWSQAMGLDLVGDLKTSFETMLGLLANGKNLAELGINVDAVMSQIPSMVILVHTMGLGFALMLERRFAVLTGLRYERIASQMKLLEFRVPEIMIWLTMFSFLVSFIKGAPPTAAHVALNVFNVMMGFYFFQGLAVMEMSFLVFRVGNFMRFLIYFLVVGQLFFLLSAVGVIDYWVDFRQRLKRWKLSERNQNNGENI